MRRINRGRRNKRQNIPKRGGLPRAVVEPNLGVVNRAERAVERAEARAGRSLVQQLAELDRRLGSGVGAAAERTRLYDRIMRKVA